MNRDSAVRMPHKEGCALYDSIPGKVQDDLEVRGLGGAPRPLNEHGELDSIPALPVDLELLGEAELGRWLNKITMWQNYAAGQIGHMLTIKRVATEKLDFVKGQVRSDKGGQPTERTDAMLTDRRYVQANYEYTVAVATVEYAEKILESLNKAYANISRQIARLQQEQNSVSRLNTVENIRHPQRVVADLQRKFPRVR